MEVFFFLTLFIVAAATCGESITVDPVVVPPENGTVPLEYSGLDQDKTTKPLIVSRKQPPPIPKLAPTPSMTTKHPVPRFNLPEYPIRVFNDEDDDDNDNDNDNDNNDDDDDRKTTVRPVVHTVPPPVHAYDIPTTKAFRSIDRRQPVALKPPPPTPYAKVNDEAEPVVSEPRKFFAPRNIGRTYTDDSNAALFENNQPQVVPLNPTYQPPTAVYNPYPYVVSRGYTVPDYPQPRFYNVRASPYRTLEYNPVTYHVPSVRNFAYSFPSATQLQVVYNPPSTVYSNNQVNYNDYLGNDYDDFLKKKKK